MSSSSGGHDSLVNIINGIMSDRCFQEIMIKKRLLGEKVGLDKFMLM